MSLSASLANVGWQGRKINLVDAPGDAGFQGDAIAALRVVEGALVVVSAVMGVEVGTGRIWHRAEDGELARVVVVNMLDRERADFFRALEALRSQLSDEEVAKALKDAVTRGEVFPVAAAVATKNLGTTALFDLLVEGVPSPAKKGGGIEIEGAGTAAFVFKTVADPFAGHINVFRVLKGTVTADTTL